MDDKLAELLNSLGAEGLDAFYFYVIAEKIEFAIFIGLCTWGVRSAWRVVKKDFQ
ncbi:hypothetical protein [uncultured Paraglaciecola sp.]|uniref:hypothetical protein n=1 Tax=uncultured Paraglaciecola sp. TaxID=1765024 RepID=UPI00260FC6E7|nr:hypothetical protein [uncultured Paraglaciecola sp.]